MTEPIKHEDVNEFHRERNEKMEMCRKHLMDLIREHPVRARAIVKEKKLEEREERGDRDS